MTLKTSLDIKMTTTATKSAELDSTTSSVMVANFRKNLADGTSESQADKRIVQELSISPSGSASVDLVGSIDDAFGDVVNLAKVKAIHVSNVSDAQTESSDASILVGGGSDPFYGWLEANDDRIVVPSGGIVAWAAPVDGKAVTGGTADKFNLTNQSATETATVQILIVGTSA